MQIRKVNNSYQPNFGMLKGVIIGENYKSFVGNKGVQRTLKAINSNRFFDAMFESKNGYIKIDRDVDRFNEYTAASGRVVTNKLSIFFEPEKQGFFSRLLNALKPHKKFDLIEESETDCAWDNLEIDEYNLMNRFLSQIRNYNEYDLDNFVREIKYGSMNLRDGFARVRNNHKRNVGYKTSDSFDEDTYAHARKSHKTKGGFRGYGSVEEMVATAVGRPRKALETNSGYRTSDRFDENGFAQTKKTYNRNGGYKDYRTSDDFGEDMYAHARKSHKRKTHKRNDGYRGYRGCRRDDELDDFLAELSARNPHIYEENPDYYYTAGGLKVYKATSYNHIFLE